MGPSLPARNRNPAPVRMGHDRSARLAGVAPGVIFSRIKPFCVRRMRVSNGSGFHSTGWLKQQAAEPLEDPSAHHQALQQRPRSLIAQRPLSGVWWVEFKTYAAEQETERLRHQESA